MFNALLIAALTLQQPQMSDSARALYQSIKQMLPEYQAARRELAAYDSEERARRRREWAEPLDTMRFGPLEVIAAKRQSRDAFALFARVYARRSAEFEGLSAQKPAVVLMEYGSPVRIFREMAMTPAPQLLYAPSHDKERQERAVNGAIDETIKVFLTPAMQAWVGDGLLRAWQTQNVYRELATSDLGVVRKCYAGDGNGCADALGLVPHDFAAWYTAKEVREMVARAALWRPDWHVHECVNRNDDAECIKSLEMYGGLPTPLTTTARANFLLYALKRGGAGSLARLGNGAALAPMTAEWRAYIERSVDEQNRNLAGVGGVAIFWVLLMLGLSFRSTRRRFG